MIITYNGFTSFRISTKPAGRGAEEIVIFSDPFDKSLSLKVPSGKADLVLQSRPHEKWSTDKHMRENPMVLSAPGEYAVKGVSVIGIDSFADTQGGKELGRNTIYLFESEDITLCHLGSLGQDLTQEQLDKIGTKVDILFIPVALLGALDTKRALSIINKIEPAIFIPMAYEVSGLTADVTKIDDFCKDFASCPKEYLPRLTLKKKDLEEKNKECILLGLS